MITLLIFIAVLALLVLSHEVGHFVAARKSGMRVYEFGFGFPPRAFGVQRLTKGTEKKWRWFFDNKENIEEITPDGWACGTIYSFNWIPIGGFVRVKGEEKDNRDPDSFIMAKTWKKALFIVAGVACNILLTIVLFSIGYIVGLPTLVDGYKDVSNVKDRQLKIMQVLSGKPAETAGIKAEDEVLKIGNIENPRLAEMQTYVDEHKNEDIALTLKRGEETVNLSVRPFIYEDSGKGGIGVGLAELGTVKYVWYKALYHGFIDTFVYLKEIFVAFGLLIGGLFVGKGAGDAVSGPIGIAVMTGQVAKMGLIYLLQFTAILSLNLAVINILPIPALDGGRLLFLVLNKFKKINFAKYEQMAHAVGFILLMLLVVVVTVRDIGNFRGVFVEFFKKVF